MVVLVTLIGDMVGSRQLPDRAAVQRRLADVLAEVTDLLEPAQRLETTVGDEFQGAFRDDHGFLAAKIFVEQAENR